MLKFSAFENQLVGLAKPRHNYATQFSVIDEFCVQESTPAN
jgi:hypothetical protein